MIRALAVLRTGLETVLNAVVPLRERTARTSARSPDDFSPVPLEHEMLGMRIVTLLEYREPAVVDLIRALKYDGSRHAAHIAAQILADYVREEMASLKIFSSTPVVLIPLPLHSSRLKERGYNQIELVLNALPKEFRNGSVSRVERRALLRSRPTSPQTHLPRADRLSNVAGAFALTDSDAVKGTHVILVDDVTTTGATLVNAAIPLRLAGAAVSLIALARA